MCFENRRALEFKMLYVLFVFHPCGHSGKRLEQEGDFLLFWRREDEIIRGFMFCAKGSHTRKWHRAGAKGTGFYCLLWVPLEASFTSLNIGFLSVRWNGLSAAYHTLFGLNEPCVRVMPSTWYIPFLLQDTLGYTVVHPDGADLASCMAPHCQICLRTDCSRSLLLPKFYCHLFLHSPVLAVYELKTEHNNIFFNLALVEFWGGRKISCVFNLPA